MALEVRATLREHASGVEGVGRLAGGTIAWLVVLGMERLYDVGLSVWLGTGHSAENDFELLVSEQLWEAIATIAAAGVFLWWLASVVRLTNAMSPSRLPWGPLASVVSFFVPMLNFVWPCRVLYRVKAALEPSVIPEPLPRGVADSSTGYREVRWSSVPAPAPLPPVPVLAWWCTYCLGTLIRWSAGHDSGCCALGSSSAWALASVVDIVSIALAIVMVRGITARLVERLRRIDQNDEEVVRAAGVILR
jgi:hypothetical protein